MAAHHPVLRLLMHGILSVVLACAATGSASGAVGAACQARACVELVASAFCERNPDHQLCPQGDDRFCEKRLDHPLCDRARFCSKRRDHPLCNEGPPPSPS
jgi:hypothetical protein